MDDRSTFTTKKYPTRGDTYLATKLGPSHRCYFGGSGRCVCGKHRPPAGVTSLFPLSTDRERLGFEL